ncbi:MAG: type II toxin-antitoxin system HicB family antitoxin [Gammaproteobacteria bacterium]
MSAWASLRTLWAASETVGFLPPSDSAAYAGLGRGVGRYTSTVMPRRFKVLLEWDSDDHVWVAYVPTLADVSTYGETRDEAIEMAREAIAGYLEAAAKEGLPVPQSDRGDVVEVEIPAP